MLSIYQSMGSADRGIRVLGVALLAIVLQGGGPWSAHFGFSLMLNLRE